mmetsp:Transcript_27711/g.66744  ORF Transcript_27711/g.66744 Transcript_27711/m.66744 type:complete len:119 (+) Transcript_27711:470-826(+)
MGLVVRCWAAANLLHALPLFWLDKFNNLVGASNTDITPLEKIFSRYNGIASIGWSAWLVLSADSPIVKAVLPSIALFLASIIYSIATQEWRIARLPHGVQHLLWAVFFAFLAYCGFTL